MLQESFLAKGDPLIICGAEQCWAGDFVEGYSSFASGWVFETALLYLAANLQHWNQSKSSLPTSSILGPLPRLSKRFGYNPWHQHQTTIAIIPSLLSPPLSLQAHEPPPNPLPITMTLLSPLTSLPLLLFLFLPILYLLLPRRNHLSLFPGPLLARYTYLYIFHHMWSARLDTFLLYLHDTYGPVVRLGPNDILLGDADEIIRTNGLRST
ncbi:hypothetical protein B0T14DRAFT_565626 [Immersiella caudata]|uniref:Uncharacterized protein n=1 Tax=Immersiella caudata TaxID=314043 RepID=A0AA39WZA1_9PEZI|nr:hypothetical protein B0T14DRAFT_565626 [Immersiella caudata]